MSAVYQVNCEAKRKIFGDFMGRNDQKFDMVKIAKGISKTNKDIIDE